MKAQDIIILLKIILLGKKSWRTTDLAHDLFLSQSEVSKGLKRLQEIKLYDANSKSVAKKAFYELLIVSISYFFPASVGKISKGVPTSIGQKVLKSKIVSDHQYIWPHINGTVKGESVSPLYPTVPDAAIKDEKLHDLLALIDALRIGRVREIKLAREELRKRIVGDE